MRSSGFKMGALSKSQISSVLILVGYFSLVCAVDLEKVMKNSESLANTTLLDYVQKSADEMISGGDSNQQEADEFSMDDRSIEQLWVNCFSLECI